MKQRKYMIFGITGGIGTALGLKLKQQAHLVHDKGGVRQGGGQLHRQWKQVIGVSAVAVHKHQQVLHRS